MLTENLLTIRDVSMTGAVVHELALPFARRRVQVRDIVAERVRFELEARADGRAAGHHELCAAEEVERLLAAHGVPSSVERHVATALRGFADNRYVVIVDGAQVTSLEQWLDIGLAPEVRFLRLVPIAGG